ncbi:hypothetical protein CGRA01v4_10446 [Colletotrichum graminicola]|uniref:Uncharacterized protein n=1 Tax=Colletotrichum graminicola (strain M1.001 / M2 / FGSC 10212) TaxID=645133 RepID=E3R016_COLGM|nr:uncharacterized protein GLRG_11605 [Colletotrichum graminicola M1.001]EFQ36460.1 hypothetical protein GLRG_11605 [Colletotrichum graminicola M1.001]WDK19159.1 hypothetical protein CGRA01v4_10446 [Colletotrichum graminicola]
MGPPSATEMSAADPEARRRARGVIAQREYRKRHATKVQTLQDENQKLKDAIFEIHRASLGCDAITDRLSAALSEARKLADISDAPATADGDMESDGAGPIACSLPAQSAQLNPLLPAANMPANFECSPNDEARGGKPSQRLDNGLWSETERLVRILEPSTDTMQYFGGDTYTMAGYIFWSTLDYTVDLWNAQSAPPATRQLDRIFNPSRPLTDRKYLVSLAQARLDFRRKGHMFRTLSEQFERIAMADLYKRVLHDYETTGAEPRYWKTPAEVADNLLSQLTPEEAARFQAVLEGGGTRADKEMLRAMSGWFVQNFVCFGDGPRWSNIGVSVALGSWIGALRMGSPGGREASPLSTETPS